MKPSSGLRCPLDEAPVLDDLEGTSPAFDARQDLLRVAALPALK
jgi:hypothetical protein